MLPEKELRLQAKRTRPRDCLLVRHVRVEQQRTQLLENPGLHGTGKPLLHLAVTDADPALPYLAKYPLALVLHKKNGVTPEVVDTLRRWLTDVQGQCLPYTQVAALYPEFTPEVVAQTFIGRI